MDSTQKSYKLFQHQSDFVHQTNKYSALVAGYGSGKTTAFCLRALKECGKNPGKRILIAEPTYPMVRDVLRPCLENALHEIGFAYEYSATEMRYRVKWKGGWADVLLRSAENYQRWAGLNLASFGIDEADQLKDDMPWKMGLSRLRDGNTLTGFVSTTPEGFKWVWSYWVDEPKPGYDIVKGKTSDNTKLPPAFIESLMQNYDERLQKAYLDGEFVNLQFGQTYYVFDRDKNVKDVQYNPALPISVGMDFNVDPITAVLCQTYHDKPKVRVFDEVEIHHNSGHELMTERIAREIKRRYNNRQITVYPDPSGRARKTSSLFTDHDILRNEGFKVIAKRTAPAVIDRVNSTNKIMDSCIISPKCRGFIRDLEQTVNKEGTREIDKSNKDLTHFSDGFGYFIDFEYPVRRPTTRTYMA